MIKTVVLAAGKGSRLKSKQAKVLHRIFDKPILSWVLDSLAEVPQEEIIVVCGHKGKELQSFLHAYPVSIAVQEPQMGTGHALMCASAYLNDFDGTLLVINGDSPMIKSETLNDLVEYHKSTGSKLTMLSCNLADPNGYGRIIRRNQEVLSIKEDKDCSEIEKTITEVNAGVYCLEWDVIKDGLKKLSNNNAQEEYYITGLVDWAYTQGHRIGSYKIHNPIEVMGVNTRKDLATVTRLKSYEAIEALMEKGVTVVDPQNTMISPDADIGYDTVIYPGTYIHRRVTIGNSCSIGPNTSIFGPAEIGSGSTVIQSHIFRSTIGENCNVGPFAHLRDGNDIGDNVRIGNFVEVKNCDIGNDTAAAHLSYLGDSKIKSKVNIGAGTVTANFNSETGEKSQTVIHSNVSTGSNSVLIAPIEIGANSMIAAGTVVTDDIPPDSLAIARPRAEIKSKQKT